MLRNEGNIEDAARVNPQQDFACSREADVKLQPTSGFPSRLDECVRKQIDRAEGIASSDSVCASGDGSTLKACSGDDDDDTTGAWNPIAPPKPIAGGLARRCVKPDSNRWGLAVMSPCHTGPAAPEEEGASTLSRLSSRLRGCDAKRKAADAHNALLKVDESDDSGDDDGQSPGYLTENEPRDDEDSLLAARKPRPNKSYPRTGKRGAPQAFPRKVFEMLSEQPADVVGWSPSGASFVIADMQRFERDVLPQYFAHRKFSSFQRQLNLYSFRRVDPGDAFEPAGSYAHDAFRRDEPELLSGVRRPKQIKPPTHAAGTRGGGGGDFAGVVAKRRRRGAQHTVRIAAVDDDVLRSLCAVAASTGPSSASRVPPPPPLPPLCVVPIAPPPPPPRPLSRAPASDGHGDAVISLEHGGSVALASDGWFNNSPTNDGPEVSGSEHDDESATIIRHHVPATQGTGLGDALLMLRAAAAPLDCTLDTAASPGCVISSP